MSVYCIAERMDRVAARCRIYGSLPDENCGAFGEAQCQIGGAVVDDAAVCTLEAKHKGSEADFALDDAFARAERVACACMVVSPVGRAHVVEAASDERRTA